MKAFPQSRSWLRFPAMGVAMASLFLALWTGLGRLGWGLAAVAYAGPEDHGPLMVAGFLGTLIGLERAVGLGQKWVYAAPLATAVGAISVVAGVPAGVLAFVLGAAVLLLATLRMAQIQPGLDTGTIALGAASFLTGNLLWWLGHPLSIVAFWWIAFLTLTIVGERLELSRLMAPPPWSRRVLAVLVALFVLGLVLVTAGSPRVGLRLIGAAALGMVLWGSRYDLARRTVRGKDLPRFVAVNVLSGYAWLGFFGALLLLRPDLSGWMYDALLHAVFLGFVFPMIFAHAPIVFPAVIGLPIRYSNRFYVHVVVLHVSLLLRIVGDLATLPDVRRWGGLLSAVALVMFLLNTASSLRRPLEDAPR